MDRDAGGRFKRAHISSYDFERAEEFIVAASNYVVASIEYEALLIAAIIYYARPFSGNERDKSSTVDSRLVSELAVFDGPVEQTLHDRIMVLRNQAVAHAESIHYPVQILPPVGKSLARGVSVASRRWHVSTERLDLLEFQALAKEMSRKCKLDLIDGALRDGG